MRIASVTVSERDEEARSASSRPPSRISPSDAPISSHSGAVSRSVSSPFSVTIVTETRFPSRFTFLTIAVLPFLPLFQ